MKKTFLRRTWSRFAKLGKGRKKKQKWKRPTGRHNKMRNKMRGYGLVVSIGYQKDKSIRGKVSNLTSIVVYNQKDLEKATRENIIIIGKVGNKKKEEIIKKANSMGVNILNMKKKSESVEEKK